MAKPIDLKPALTEIAAEPDAQKKGRKLEALIRDLFCSLDGITLEGEDVVNAYWSEEIDLIFWNDRRSGLLFLDCPLIVECKAWSKAVSGREVRYFATELKDKGRSNGVFIALNGVTGNFEDLTAAFFHLAAAMIGGVTVLVITGEELAALTDAEELATVFRRKLLQMVRQQILVAKSVDDEV